MADDVTAGGTDATGFPITTEGDWENWRVTPPGQGDIARHGGLWANLEGGIFMVATEPQGEDRYNELDAELDAIDWEWLCEVHPVLASVVEKFVSQGGSPAEIHRRVMARNGRHELARRCGQAAEYCHANQ